MLNAARLDDIDYNKIFERARGMIPTFTNEWTDLNFHDPGITTLQTFAWLYDTLNYYLNATGEAHRLKYLKLLGITPCKSAAQCSIAIDSTEERILLPKGTKLTAGDTVFELEETYLGDANKLIRLYNEVNGKILDLTCFAGVDGDFAPVFTLDFEKSSCVYFGFEHPMDENARFYAEVKQGGRNPFDGSFTLSNRVWEYYNGASWCEAPVIVDETCGFLQGGFIELSLKSKMAALENTLLDNAYYLRCRLIQNEYDALPEIGRVFVNCVSAIQQNTYAQVLEYVADGSEYMWIDCYVNNTDLITVAVQKGEEYTEWYFGESLGTDKCKVLQGNYSWQRKVQFCGEIPASGNRVLIMLATQSSYEAMQLGITDGCAEQRFGFNVQNLYELRLALVKEDDDGIRKIQLWNYCEDISSASYDEQVFGYDEESGYIVFGNSIHGVQPEAGLLVLAVTVKTSLLDKGNVLKGQVNTILDQNKTPYSVINTNNATGGKKSEKSKELEKKIEEKMHMVTRAVTEDDYKKIVRNTPGLIIDSVSVISIKEYCKAYKTAYVPNTVLVAVKPQSQERLPKLSNTYKQMIEQNLERYRLLTTNIKVISAKYVGISVFGRIQLRENHLYVQENVNKCITNMIDMVVTGEFGKGIDYGRLFSAIEMVDGVKSIAQLSLECVGEGGRKEEYGDFTIFPDSLSYVREIGIEFI